MSNLQYYTYLFIVLVSWLMTLPSFRRLPIALQLFSLLTGLTFFTECLACFMAVRYHNNMMVYNLYSPVQIILTVLYFHFSMDELRRYYLGYVLAAFCLVVFLLNTWLLQPLSQMNTYYLFFEALLTILLSLFFFLRNLLNNTPLQPHGNPYFWINLILLFFWSVTMLTWGLYDYLNEVDPGKIGLLNLGILFVNFICFAGIGCTYRFQTAKLLRHD